MEFHLLKEVCWFCSGFVLGFFCFVLLFLWFFVWLVVLLFGFFWGVCSCQQKRLKAPLRHQMSRTHWWNGMEFSSRSMGRLRVSRISSRDHYPGAYSEIFPTQWWLMGITSLTSVSFALKVVTCLSFSQHYCHCLLPPADGQCLLMVGKKQKRKGIFLQLTISALNV